MIRRLGRLVSAVAEPLNSFCMTVTAFAVIAWAAAAIGGGH